MCLPTIKKTALKKTKKKIKSDKKLPSNIKSSTIVPSRSTNCNIEEDLSDAHIPVDVVSKDITPEIDISRETEIATLQNSLNSDTDKRHSKENVTGDLKEDKLKVIDNLKEIKLQEKLQIHNCDEVTNSSNLTQC